MTCANCNASVKEYDTLGFAPPAPATVAHRKGACSSPAGHCKSLAYLQFHDCTMLTGAAKRAKDNLARLIDLTKADDEMWNGPQSPAPKPRRSGKGKEPATSEQVGTTLPRLAHVLNAVWWHRPLSSTLTLWSRTRCSLGAVTDAPSTTS